MATFINQGRTTANSKDLRWRMVWQREALGLHLKAVACNLGVDPSTFSRTASLFRSTGSVQKRHYPKDARPNKKHTKPVQLTILHTVLQWPDIYFANFRRKCSYLPAYKSMFPPCAFF